MYTYIHVLGYTVHIVILAEIQIARKKGRKNIRKENDYFLRDLLYICIQYTISLLCASFTFASEEFFIIVQ